MVTMAMPLAQNVIRSFRLSAATTAISGAIQGTRYRAIMRGCPYTISFSNTSTSYQVASNHCRAHHQFVRAAFPMMAA